MPSFLPKIARTVLTLNQVYDVCAAFCELCRRTRQFDLSHQFKALAFEQAEECRNYTKKNEGRMIPKNNKNIAPRRERFSNRRLLLLQNGRSKCVLFAVKKMVPVAVLAVSDATAEACARKWTGQSTS
jgi:hypothetical protein